MNYLWNNQNPCHQLSYNNKFSSIFSSLSSLKIINTIIIIFGSILVNIQSLIFYKNKHITKRARQQRFSTAVSFIQTIMRPNQQQNRNKRHRPQNQQQKSNNHQQHRQTIVLDQDIDSNKIKFQGLRKCNWSRKQKIKYLVFINYYTDLPNWGSDLKSIPTYKTLSNFIKTRSPEQCKSFHLALRRNFKSMEELIKRLHDELQEEEGFEKMLNKYDIEIIGFEQQQKILQFYGLEQKQYYKDKLLQKIKQSNLPKQQFDQICNQKQGSDQQGNNNGNSGQQKYNFKFNIKQLIPEDDQNNNKNSNNNEHNSSNYNNGGKNNKNQHQINNTKAVKTESNNNIRSSSSINNNKGLMEQPPKTDILNGSYFVGGGGYDNNNNLMLPGGMPTMPGGQQPQQGMNKNHMIPGLNNVSFFIPQQPNNMNLFGSIPPQINNNRYGESNSNNALNSNGQIDQMRIQEKQQQQPPGLTSANSNTGSANNNAGNMTSGAMSSIGINDSRGGNSLLQDNYKRMMDMNKTPFPNPFGAYGGYQPANSFPDISRMGITQFPGQIPFPMPPPGGIPYLLQPYNPYGYTNPTMPGRFQPASQQVSGEIQNGQNFGNKVNQQSNNGQNINKKIAQTVSNTNINSNNGNNDSKKLQTFPSSQSMQGNIHESYEQKRKQLLFKCHQHWVNWLRSALQIQKRKKEQQSQQTQMIVGHNI